MRSSAIRLAVYCPDFYPNETGFSHAFQDLVRGLCDHGVRVDVFTPIALNKHRELEAPGLRVIRVRHSNPFRRIKYVRAVWNVFAKPRQTAAVIVREHNREPYDLLVSESLDDPLVIFFLPVHLQARTVVRIHGTADTEVVQWNKNLLARIKRAVIGWLLRDRLRFIAATTDHYLDFVRKWYLHENVLLIAEKRFCVVPNSAPCIAKSPRASFAEAGRVHFLTLGRMDWMGANQKGFDDILLAMMHLDAQQRARVRLTIVGRGCERARLERLARGVDKARIEFIEALPNAEIRRLLGQVDCVVLASRYEGMSMFALEALGSAAPVIFSDAGGLAALVEGNGELFAAGDPRSLAAAIERFLVASEAELSEMSRASLRLAAHLTPEIAAGSLLRFSQLVAAQANV